MSNADTEARAERSMGVVGERLFRGRWTILAALVAIGLVSFAAGGQFLLAASAMLAVVLVAAFAPRRRVLEVSARTSIAGVENAVQVMPATALAAAIPDPLIIFDRKGIARHANSAALATFGPINPGLALQLKFRAPEMRDLLARTLAEPDGSASVEYAERVPIERVFRVTTAPIGRGEGLYALMFKDQSEASRIDRMRADFIANASHEMRTPLASIAGFVETLRGPARNDAKARDQFLSIIQDQTGRMTRLIDDLLSLSRLEMKPLLSSGAKVDLKQTVDSVIDSLAPLAAENHVLIERDYHAGALAVPGSRDELFQVFENLLENACKYGQSGGKVVVTIREHQDGPEPEAVVSFRDFGPGIPEEHIPRVTERFYRVDVETSRTHKGTGLGLSIVKHILTRHNARLAIRSERGAGAEFSVYLPLGAGAPRLPAAN